MQNFTHLLPVATYIKKTKHHCCEVKNFIARQHCNFSLQKLSAV